MAVARGILGPPPYTLAAGSIGSSVEEILCGVTFGRKKEQRQVGPRAMPRVRFPPFEHYGGACGEGGDRPCSSVELKVGRQMVMHPDLETSRFIYGVATQSPEVP